MWVPSAREALPPQFPATVWVGGRKQQYSQKPQSFSADISSFLHFWYIRLLYQGHCLNYNIIYYSLSIRFHHVQSLLLITCLSLSKCCKRGKKKPERRENCLREALIKRFVQNLTETTEYFAVCRNCLGIWGGKRNRKKKISSSKDYKIISSPQMALIKSCLYNSEHFEMVQK